MKNNRFTIFSGLLASVAIVSYFATNVQQVYAEEKMKVALIGYGHLGRWHAQKLYKIYEGNFCSVVELGRRSPANCSVTN